MHEPQADGASRPETGRSSSPLISNDGER